MKEYGDVLTGTADEGDARAFASRVRDVSEFLHALGLVDPPALREPRTVAYHDACHLAHAQGIRTPPRALLARVANLRVLEIADGEVCCGSAGLYNVEQPAIAGDLGARKAQAILATGADMVAAGNIGWTGTQPTWHEPERRGACSTRCRCLTRRIGCVRSTEAYPGQAVSASESVNDSGGSHGRQAAGLSGSTPRDRVLPRRSTWPEA